MNYLFFIPSWSYRGGERIFLKFAKKLKEKGNKVVVVCGRKDETNAQSSPVTIKYSKLFNKILQNDLIFFAFSWVVMFGLALKVDQEIDEVVTESNQCLWAATLYSQIKKTRLTWYVMAYEEKHFDNSFYNFLYEASFGLIERVCALRVDTFYVLAPRVKRAIDKKYKIYSKILLPTLEKTKIDFKKVRNDLKQIVDKNKVLFLPAALHWKKNQSLAIGLLDRHKNFFLVLAGEGKDREKLENLALKLKVNQKVFFAGVLDQNNMAFMYKNSYLTLVCSLNENEGLSLTALESLLYKTPVLVSTNAGVAEIIKGRKSVYIAKPTLNSFSAVLKKIYN